MSLSGRLVSGALLWVACLLPVSAATPVVHEYRLENGLELRVLPDHRAPVVTSQVWYRVGSADEPGGSTGLSHALEHMMFKGTQTLPPGAFSRVIAEHGGRENAFTSRDYTAYFQTLAPEHLEIAFRLEADRMRSLKLDAGEFAREIEVIKEERRLRTEDDPEARLNELFQATAFVSNGYHHPVIGWMADLDHMRVEDLRAWYARHYAPNNAILVVVGDVEPQAVLGLAKKYFGALPSGELPSRRLRRDTAQDGERRVVLRAPAKLPSLLMGYKVPTLVEAPESWEPYALEVLSGVLDGGEAARFANRLVRTGLAAGAGAGYDPMAREGGLFILGGTPSEGVEPLKLEQALRGEIERLRNEPVDPAELSRVKAQVLAQDIFGRDSNFYQAMRIGIAETVGLGAASLDAYLAGIEAVTREQVQAVARKYLIDDHLTVARLDPLPMDVSARPVASAQGGTFHAR
ncbi:MAG: pitrilysin family protein [Halothiobacillaceae bacterium]|mgnify:CR=1 FL=1|nr:pitrilysin family protein [Halothiobacillaceae bacterium]